MTNFNLFKFLKKYEDEINTPLSEKKYWEDKKIAFNKYTLGIDGNYYDEEELYKQYKKENKDRLLKFG